MARILQVRRGTTAQNDKFTGLVGEITYDTDAKTLRVHDGKTLGGFALAQADGNAASGGAGGNCDCTQSGGTFDITTVSDEFWAKKIPQFTPAPFTVLESKNTPINPSASYLDCVFSTKSPATFVRVFLVCQVAEAGYTAGDEVASFGIGPHVCPTPNTYVDTEGLHTCLMIGAQSFWVAHKNTGVTTNITATNWRVKFRVYC